MAIEKLKLTLAGIRLLKEEAGVDLFKGAKLNLDSVETVGWIYSAATQHWSKPVSFDEAMKMDAVEIISGLNPILASFGGAAGAPNPPRKKARGRR